MRVVIGVLADANAARALARGWVAGGCPAARLHLFAALGVALDRSLSTGAPATPCGVPPAPAPAFVRLGRHEAFVLWGLEVPPGERSRSSRRDRRRRRALRLLAHLVAVPDERPAHAGALADGRPLCIVQLDRSDPDPLPFVRPLLAHAAGRVRVHELVARA